MSEIKQELLDSIFRKVDENEDLTQEEAVELLNIENCSQNFYRLLAKAQELTRKEYGGRGYVFAQIGLNSTPCPGNCRFCSMGCDNFMVEEEVEKTEEEIVNEAERAAGQKIDALFLMTTVNYDIGKFLGIVKKVKAVLPEDVMLVANIGDFDNNTAQELKEAGITAVYHIVRLNEGTDTAIAPEERIRTLDAIRSAGLELIYCVEPIGPEHTYRQIAEEMLRARAYDVDIMACMKRVGVEGTPLYERGEITDLELTKIAAVTRLVTRPRTSMNVHEPKQMTLLAGVNQLYAEIGINPRDCAVETGTSRGYSIAEVKEMLRQMGYKTK